ncbi:MAG: hypothetical protein M3454_00440 [Actinomycetota bacterium]|nr:hypothetical protein [Actinomycetota bacterium]
MAETFGWAPFGIEETIEPETALEPLARDDLRVPAGGATGLRQHCRVMRGGSDVISLDLRMSAAVTEPVDAVDIDGHPPVRCVIENGLSGDVGTAGVVNALVRVVRLEPGLVTMPDLRREWCPNRSLGRCKSASRRLHWSAPGPVPSRRRALTDAKRS